MARFGSGVLRGQPWVGGDGGKDPLSFDSGYYLLPVLRRDAVKPDADNPGWPSADDPAGFPDVQRVALHSNLWARLAAW